MKQVTMRHRSKRKRGMENDSQKMIPFENSPGSNVSPLRHQRQKEITYLQWQSHSLDFDFDSNSGQPKELGPVRSQVIFKPSTPNPMFSFLTSLRYCAQHAGGKRPLSSLPDGHWFWFKAWGNGKIGHGWRYEVCVREEYFAKLGAST